MSLLGAVPDRTARPRADPSWDVQALFLLPGKEPELLVTLRGAQASSHPLVHGACSWRWSWGRESVWICWPGGGFCLVPGRGDCALTGLYSLQKLLPGECLPCL